MSSEDTASLEHRFTAWCQTGGADTATSASLWSRLAVHYSEPRRHYHHLGHIAASLTELDHCGSAGFAIEGAIWFHDVIYDPHRSDNEDASVAWFRASTEPWLDPVLSTRIAALIEATDFRRPRIEDPESSLMVDIDLAILSAPEELYDAYCAAIRKEYAHVPDDAFRVGRAKVMAAFLERPIYRTPHFALREAAARANIAREIARLGPGPA